jgi:hypothetical protein
MSLFEYLGVLISVVMGLGITHLLTGISKVIQHRDTVRVYWVHVLWTVNILLYIIVIWWGLFWWSKLPEWSFFEFLFVTLYAIALFLLAALLYPWDIPLDFDFRRYFLENRAWFFGLQAIAWCIDIPETILKADMGLRDLPEGYVFFVSILLTLSLVGAFTRSRRFHGFFAVFWLCALLTYLGTTTLARIAA